MARQDRDTLKAYVNANINTNAIKSITGAKNNTALMNLADSVVFYNENPSKQNVRVATTTNGTLSTAFANGQTIDGVVIATGNRILIKDQGTASVNGVYTVNASGAPTRATDFDTSDEILLGAEFYVEEGTTNGGKYFYLSAPTGTITVGTSNLVFSPSASTGFDIASLSAFSGNIDGTNDQLPIYDQSAASNKKIALGDVIGTYGTFTPVLQFGGASVGITYGTQEGHYTSQPLPDGKKLVTVSGFLSITSKGSSTGQMGIFSMPEAGTSTIDYQHFQISSLKGASTFNPTGVFGVLGGTPMLRILVYKDNTMSSTVTDADITVSSSITFAFHGTYIAG